MGRNHSSDLLDKWLKEENLLLLECWSRDGYTQSDIARRIGINDDTLSMWKKRFPEIANALNTGRELTDYKVENALLKSALGYKTKDVKVTTVMRYGKVVETVKETTDREVPPSVQAIQMWLYNRQRDKWKNMNGSRSIVDEMGDDGTIEITVTRATKNESVAEPEEGEEVDTKQIHLRKRTEEEAEEYRSDKKKQKAMEEADTIISDTDDEEVVDLDEWPEDWQDED